VELQTFLDSPLTSHYFWGDVVKVHLHWLLTQEVDGFYVYYGLAPTTANRLHKWTCSIVCFVVCVAHFKLGDWATEFVFLGPWQNQKRLALQTFPSQFTSCTLILDGKAFKLRQFCSKSAATLYLPEIMTRKSARRLSIQFWSKSNTGRGCACYLETIPFIKGYQKR
jgi:hypothetical protein